MSFSVSNVVSVEKPIRIEGARIFRLPPDSASDYAYARAAVVCEKHPEQYQEFYVSVLDPALLESTARILLAKCPGCLDKTPWEETRFPEGAEL